VISKIAPDLLILVSSSLAKILTTALLYATSSTSLGFRSTIEDEEEEEDKGGDIIRAIGTNIANMPTIGAEDMIAFVKRYYYYYYLFLLAG
jgi:hypothetical protein